MINISKNMKHLLFLVSVFLCTNLCAENCDSTFQLFKTIKRIGIDPGAKYPQELKRLKKDCILDILDSVNDKNYYQIIHLVTMYYVFVEPNAFKGMYVEKTDSAIAAKICYGLSNKNSEIAKKCHSHLEITKQLLWILQRDSVSRRSLQEYIVNRNGNVSRNIVSCVSEIRDTAPFWLIYKNIKEERKNAVDALNYLMYCSVEYFGYYALFVENEKYLSDLGLGCVVSHTLCDKIAEKYNYNIAKRTYSKLILNRNLMQRHSACSEGRASVSVFNYDFSYGIEIFYPELAKMDEYINSCMKYEKQCEFDERLYKSLVKTIKAEYKDLK